MKKVGLSAWMRLQEKKDKKAIIPKVYNDQSIEMKGKKESIQGFIYFNQADAAWNLGLMYCVYPCFKSNGEYD